MAERDRDDRRRDRDDDDRSARRRDDRDDDRRSSRRDDDDRGSRRRDDDDDRGRRSRDRDDDRDSRRGRDDDDRGSSRSSFRYERRSADDTRRRSEQAGNNEFDKFLKPHIKMWRPNDGDNRIRILPPTWPKAQHFGYDVYVHYGVGPDRQSYLCRDKMLQERDPIAEAYAQARADLRGDERDDDPVKKMVKDLEAKRRVLVYLIDRDHEKEGVQAWAMPWTLDRDITQVMQDKRSGEVLPIDDPDEGYDIEFTKKGSKARTEYTGVAVARRSSPLGDGRWLDFAVENPLPDQLQFFDYEHIARAFGGGGKQRTGRDDDRDSRRDDDDRGSRGRARDDDDLTYAKVQDMTRSELEDVIDQKRLDINPDKARSTEDLADWICEELRLEKPRKRDADGHRDDDRRDDPEERMRAMRDRRERD